MNTFEFEFYPSSEHEHRVSVSFEQPADLHISELHRMCKAFALALGYDYRNIEEYFGKDRWEEGE